jgi:hypothetical protein
MVDVREIFGGELRDENYLSRKEGSEVNMASERF